MKILKYVLIAMIIPMAALAQTTANVEVDANAVLNTVIGLHPAVGPVLGAFWGIIKVADIFIPEGSKAGWPSIARKAWDWFLLNVGQSRNAGSADAPEA